MTIEYGVFSTPFPRQIHKEGQVQSVDHDTEYPPIGCTLLDPAMKEMKSISLTFVHIIHTRFFTTPSQLSNWWIYIQLNFYHMKVYGQLPHFMSTVFCVNSTCQQYLSTVHSVSIYHIVGNFHGRKFSQMAPYSGKFSWEKIFAVGSINENLQIKFSWMLATVL